MWRFVLMGFFLFLTPIHSETDRAALLRGINQIRAEHHLGPLKADSGLDAYAGEWAEHLTELGKLEHRTGSMLKDYLREHQARFLNENLHYSWGVDSPLEALDGWMNSPPHRRNLLEPEITHAGLGIATVQKKGRKVIYVVFNGAALEK
jgi:uncharacterized protein YkwD